MWKCPAQASALKTARQGDSLEEGLQPASHQVAMTLTNYHRSEGQVSFAPRDASLQCHQLDVADGETKAWGKNPAHGYARRW